MENNNNKEVDQNNIKDNRSVKDKIDDASDAVFETLEDLTMGEEKPFNEGIPATFRTGNDTRKVNKIQTRKNISRKVLNHGGAKILIIIFVIGGLVALGYYLINLLLLR